MTIKELIDQLQKYPEDTELEDIKIGISILRHKNLKIIKALYVANYRIFGGKPLGNETENSCQTDLANVSNSLLLGLKFKDFKEEVK